MDDSEKIKSDNEAFVTCSEQNTQEMSELQNTNKELGDEIENLREALRKTQIE